MSSTLPQVPDPVHRLPKHCGTSASPHPSTSPAISANQSIYVSDFHVTGMADASRSQARNYPGPGFGRARVIRAGAAARQPLRYTRWRSAANPTEPARRYQTNPTQVEIAGVRSHAVAEPIQRSGRSASAEKYKTNPMWRRNRQTIDSRRRRQTWTLAPDEPDLRSITKRSQRSSHAVTERSQQSSRNAPAEDYKTKPTWPSNPTNRSFPAVAPAYARTTAPNKTCMTAVSPAAWPLEKTNPLWRPAKGNKGPCCPPAEYLRKNRTRGASPNEAIAARKNSQSARTPLPNKTCHERRLQAVLTTGDENATLRAAAGPLEKTNPLWRPAKQNKGVASRCQRIFGRTQRRGRMASAQEYKTNPMWQWAGLPRLLRHTRSTE